MTEGKQENQVVQLREVDLRDLPIFFEFQLDPDANQMAAFTSKDPSNREAFEAHWQKILADQSTPIQTILFGGQVAGSVLSYVIEGGREVSYWIGKEFWGRSIATRALALYLDFITEHPLYARAAKDNLGSIRVLEKNGFKVIAAEKGFANARGKEIEESILILDN